MLLEMSLAPRFICVVPASRQVGPSKTLVEVRPIPEPLGVAVSAPVQIAEPQDTAQAEPCGRAGSSLPAAVSSIVELVDLELKSIASVDVSPPPGFSGLRAGPMVFVPPREGAPVGPPTVEPRPAYVLEAETTVAVNSEDIAQPCVDLQTAITPCSEESRTPIASSCVAAEDVASHEHRRKTFTEEVTRPIRSPLLPRPIKSKRAPIPPPQGQLELPKRSERLANHPLASVASSKRAEMMLMRRFNVIP